MWEKVRRFIASPVFENDPDKTRAASTLNPLLIGLFGLVIFLSLGTLFAFANKLGAVAMVGIMAIELVASKVLLQRGRVRLAQAVYITGTWLLVTVVLALSGGKNALVSGYVGLVVVAGLWFGARGAMTVSILSGLTFLGFAIADLSGYELPRVFPGPLIADWFMLTAILAQTVIPMRIVMRNLNESLQQSQALATNLAGQQRQLQNLVGERTRELERRAGYLGATTAIAREAVAVQRDPQGLFARAVRVISEQFGFYHTGLFLLDERGEAVVLQAASSEGGQRMIARGHQLRAGDGMVGDVARSGKYRIAQDVRRDAAFQQNPDLPETRSEIALPLLVRDQAIGVLDIQSTAADAFSQEDVTVLQALADQVSVAISNARLLRQAEQSIEAERRAYGELTREAWRSLTTQTNLGFLSNTRMTAPIGDEWRPEMQKALRTGQQVIDQDPSILAMPVRVRGEIVGVLDGRKPGGEAWQPEEIELLEAIIAQLDAALEGARLYQDTQRRAVRERTLREVTARVRSSTDPETVLKSLLREVGNVLNRETFVRLGSAEQLAHSPQTSTGNDRDTRFPEGN